ncbi:MAG TPA: formate dehydrogenase accessory protein FdhE [Pyrinomonadaceae bacterium]
MNTQKQIYDSLRARRDWLPSGSLEDDLSVLQEHARVFLKVVSSVAPPALAEQADASDELLLEYWLNRSDKLFFPKAFLQPYAHWSVQSGALGRQSSTPENRCPYCFGKPQLSFLRVTESGSESGNRHLLCATCLSSWEYRRVVCASCSEERPFKLEYFKSDEFDHVRIEACESCKQYIKGIDLTRLGLAVPLVDDVATAALDLWATEKGYAKIELNLVGL